MTDTSNPLPQSAAMSQDTVLARRRSLFWRIHLWAAFIATPFALIATLTGLLYVFTPQIENALHGHLDRVTPQGRAMPLDDLVKAAQQAAPSGMALRSVVASLEDGDTVQAVFRPQNALAGMGEHAGHQHAPAPAKAAAPGSERMPSGVVLYINPYTAQVLGSHPEMERFSLWARRLHSSLLQGEGWRWLIELSASWLMVMLMTGVYLWWPRGRAAVAPATRAQGRKWWQHRHALVGVSLALMSLVILTTGLTWSKYAGEQIKALRDVSGQAPPSAPKGLKSQSVPDQAPLGWEAVWKAAQSQAPDVSMQLTPPTTPQGVWRVSNYDRSQPEKRFNLVLDAYSGQPLFYAGWAEQTAFSKATAIGIPFHRGEFGLWNQAVLVVFGLGVLFSLVSGWVMFFKRRRAGLLGLPRLAPGSWRLVPLGAWFAAVLMGALMPLLALSAAVVAAAEVGMAWRQRRHAIPQPL